MPVDDRRPVLLATHISAGDSGQVSLVLDRASIPHETLRLNKGQLLPPVLAHYRGVISFGGAQSATDDHLDYIAAELRWLEQAIEAGFPVFGICLGAQMVARVLGATVGRHTDSGYAFGWAPVSPVGDDPLGLGDPLNAYHRHGEVFTLPAGATLAATRPGWPNQAFTWGSNVVATQFHPEVNLTLLKHWLARERPLADEHHAGVQDIEVQLDDAHAHIPFVHRWLEASLHGWLGVSDHHYNSANGIAGDKTLK